MNHHTDVIRFIELVYNAYSFSFRYKCCVLHLSKLHLSAQRSCGQLQAKDFPRLSVFELGIILWGSIIVTYFKRDKWYSSSAELVTAAEII